MINTEIITWVPLSERLPEIDQFVLLRTPDGFLYYSYLDKDYDEDSMKKFKSDYTHWAKIKGPHSVWTHKEKGGEYFIVKNCEMKIDKKWVLGVIYQSTDPAHRGDAENHQYVRTQEDFLENFKAKT